MLRRATALLLWTYFAWYLGALIAHATGLSSLVGPLAGLAMASFAIYDWRRPRRNLQPTPVKEFQLSR